MDSAVWMRHPVHHLHEVSSDGRVQTITRQSVTRDGRTVTYIGRDISQRKDSYGYPIVALAGYVPGKNPRIRVHVLVCETFQGLKPAPGHEVRHLNGNINDNRAENLAWGSRKENQQDSIRHGTKSGMSKTHCKYGHDYTPENTGIGGCRNTRYCKECARKRNREAMRRKRAAARLGAADA